MDANEQIDKFKEFIEANYHSQLTENIRKGNKFLFIDFSELSKFDPELADLLLDQPDDVITAAELAIEQFDLSEKRIKIRFSNLPESSKVKIVDNRAIHINKFMKVIAEVKRTSKVIMNATSAKFECPSCGNIINILQLDSSFKEPSRCGCGRKGKFKLCRKEIVDIQELTIMDPAEDMEEGEQFQELTVILKDDLASPKRNKKLYTHGNSVVVYGFFRELPLTTKSGSKSTKIDKYLEANQIEPLVKEDTEFIPTKEEIKEFEKMAKGKNHWRRLVDSLAPDTYGYETLKEAILLQLVGGIRRKKPAGTFRRGDIHIFIPGDPGTSKTELLLQVKSLLPRSRFVGGKGVSGVGLVGGVRKNEFLAGFTADPGAMVLANDSLVCVDQLDSIDGEELDHLLNALEQQFVTIDKAGVHTRFNTITRLLAAANPKFGRFDAYGLIAEQFAVKSNLLNRFDLIFPIKDIPDTNKDEKLAEFILDISTGTAVKNKGDELLNQNTLRKYITAVRYLKPHFTKEAKEAIKKYYIQMRNCNNSESGQKAIAITARQLDGMQRLAEAYAKTHFLDKVTKKAAEIAIRIMDHSLREIGLDPESGKIDIDRIATGITASQRNYIKIIKEIIDELENKLGKIIPMDDIISESKEKGISEDKVEEVIEKLKRSGDIYMTKPNTIQKI